MTDQPLLATFEPPPDDAGYISPDFDLPEHPSEDEDMAPPPSKRNKTEPGSSQRTKNSATTFLEDEEEFALRLLGRA